MCLGVSRIIVAVIFFSFTFTSGAILFYDDAEDHPKESDWFNLVAPMPEGSYVESSEVQARSGNGSYRFFLPKYDPDYNYRTSRGDLHIELRLNNPIFEGSNKFKIGREYWVGYSVYFPSDFDFPSQWLLTGQAHSSYEECDVGPNGQPYSFQIRGNDEIFYWNMRIVCEPGDCVSSKSEQVEHNEESPAIRSGEWNDVVMHLKFEYSKPGINEVWLNGVKWVDNQGDYCNAQNDPGGPDFRFGIYGPLDNDTVLYYDEIRIGDSGSFYDEVVPKGEVPVCVSDWNCSWEDWGDCFEGEEKREYACLDLNGCLDREVREDEIRICIGEIDYDYEIFKTGGPIVIDGNLDEFDNVDPILITGEEGTFGKYKLMWDDEALFIAVEIEDSDLSSLHKLDDLTLWEDDSFEIMFDTENNKGGSRDADDYKFVVNLNGNVLDAQNRDSSWDTEVEREIILNESFGYVMEIRIPWWDFVDERKVWGMNIQLNDKDGDNFSQSDWSDAGLGVNVPDGWKNVFFSEENVGEYHIADLDKNFEIDFSELVAFLKRWELDEVILTDVIEVVGRWKKGR